MGVRTGVRTAVLTCVRTGRRPQRRPTRSLPLSLAALHLPSAATAHVRPAPRPCRLTPSKTIGLHHAPVAASMPSRSSFISTGASLVVASRRCSCCSRSRLPSVISAPPDPCSIRSPSSSLHLLVVVPESRPDSSQPLPHFCLMVWGCGWELEERDSWLYQAKSAAAIRCIGRTDRAGVRGHCFEALTDGVARATVWWPAATLAGATRWGLVAAATPAATARTLRTRGRGRVSGGRA